MLEIRLCFLLFHIIRIADTNYSNHITGTYIFVEKNHSPRRINKNNQTIK